MYDNRHLKLYRGCLRKILCDCITEKMKSCQKMRSFRAIEKRNWWSNWWTQVHVLEKYCMRACIHACYSAFSFFQCWTRVQYCSAINHCSLRWCSLLDVAIFCCFIGLFHEESFHEETWSVASTDSTGPNSSSSQGHTKASAGPGAMSKMRAVDKLLTLSVYP